MFTFMISAYLWKCVFLLRKMPFFTFSHTCSPSLVSTLDLIWSLMFLEQATKLQLVFYGSKNLASEHVIEVYERALPKCRQYIGGLNAPAAAASCLECAH